MQKTSYKKVYHRLVQLDNLAKIKTILHEQSGFDSATVEKIQYKEENNPPYLFVEVDSGKYLGHGNYGMIDGNFLNMEAIVPDWPGVFYLPIIFLRKPRNARMKALVEKKKILEHELEHLAGLLDYIDADPSYIARAHEVSITASTLENVGRSIHFEIEKIFQQEAPILAKDYKKGENTVAIADGGALFEIIATTADQFIRYQLAQYLSGLLDLYFKRFPEHKELIQEIFKKEVNAQGRAFFGENAMMRIAVTIFELFSLARNPLRATRHDIDDFD